MRGVVKLLEGLEDKIFLLPSGEFYEFLFSSLEKEILTHKFPVDHFFGNLLPVLAQDTLAMSSLRTSLLYLGSIVSTLDYLFLEVGCEIPFNGPNTFLESRHPYLPQVGLCCLSD